MKWDFRENGQFDSRFHVDDFATPFVEQVVKRLQVLFPGLERVNRDPLEDYLRMHREAAQTLGTDRAKRAFADSAERRVAMWGESALLRLVQDELNIRMVVTQYWISILGSPSTDRTQVRPIAEEIAVGLSGTLTEIIY